MEVEPSEKTPKKAKAEADPRLREDKPALAPDQVRGWRRVRDCSILWAITGDFTGVKMGAICSYSVPLEYEGLPIRI
jgi:hypothetical protein